MAPWARALLVTPDDPSSNLGTQVMEAKKRDSRLASGVCTHDDNAACVQTLPREPQICTCTEDSQVNVKAISKTGSYYHLQSIYSQGKVIA